MIYKCHGKCVEGERYDNRVFVCNGIAVKLDLPRITFPQVINGETVQYFSEFTIEPKLYAVEPKILAERTERKYRRGK